MLFFDLDGTLVDHDHAVKKAVATMLDKADFPRTHREEELLAVWNRVLRDYYQLYLQKKLSLEEQRMERIRAFCRHFDIRPDESEIETWFQVYLQAYEDHWRLYEDVPGCLNAFGERPSGHHQQRRFAAAIRQAAGRPASKALLKSW